MSGFKKFLLRGNVVDLAVAVVIGAAFGAVVQAFVKGFITPLIGVFGGIPDFSTWYVTAFPWISDCRLERFVARSSGCVMDWKPIDSSSLSE